MVYVVGAGVSAALSRYTYTSSTAPQHPANPSTVIIIFKVSPFSASSFASGVRYFP